MSFLCFCTIPRTIVLKAKSLPSLCFVNPHYYLPVCSVNRELIELYWNVGSFISNKIEASVWGESVVEELAEYLKKSEPNLKGFSNKNLWRMKQFYETYRHFPNLSALLREISWTHNLTIMSRAKLQEEREFIGLAKQYTEHTSQKELVKQMKEFILELGKDFLFVDEELLVMRS